ncbi:excinuclease ABC subunit A [Clostridium tetani]|uniref:UvrABC system protein A n=1 Tax=Clostridium tetani (strain Massachusetts / E88) TaxID=212717 RepID=UVRA_CLOTE|nr:excinuclease ABC subunit UvrA [Clostridium tetani]Q890X9.2 RecName: Full=UvrABC system protein A; Short=UvrA protein; AltName: Full=Excinuclease ABC subunit A [Clostridium tetani E88]KGI38656.1 excinuclease ABC subunit A [Clostridium tetani]KGI44101.1 excinuclease ABC subunit A [Clostridium tetani]KHO30974.1 excinuclease ABC subunit A [Clostridium tetani]KIG20974.1 excinuclease ABC subunit A [Clostridium tetani]RXI60419.1 excinuclease ABC subunit A [Clostridium tetani]
MRDKIVVKGAKVHNLKNVDLQIPRDKFVVFTGLSGSGKSSLAFDTLYAEGQRRYVESLSAYARQFLGQMDKPDVEYIEGLSPAISIDQKTTSKNPRSTVGTVTEIYDYLRLLYARVGKPHCPKCGKEIQQQTVDQMIDKILELPERTRIQVLAPIIKGRKGEHIKVIENIIKGGYVRARIDGEIIDLQEESVKLEKNKKHTIEAVIDRIIIKSDIRSRLADSIEIALKLSEGVVIINVIDKEDILFSENFACIDCGISIDEISPRLFSFNSPFGKCDYCDGLGTLLEIDEKLVIPNKSKSILEGGILPWANTVTNEDSWTFSILKALSKKYNFSLNTPIGELDEEIYNMLLYGIKGERIKVRYKKDGRAVDFNHTFEGLMNTLKRRYMETNSNYMKDNIENYMSDNFCPKCKGARLKPEALAVTLGEKNIFEFCKMSIREELRFLSELMLSNKNKIISNQILKEIESRLQFLIDVGLDYLDLARMAGTLSGGEAQRIRLATQIGSSLVGVLYILDEPSIGLHQRDNDRLIATLKRLRDLGNTLIVVEHDEDTMRAADYIVDIGPGAGEHGGEIVAAGDLKTVMETEGSLTGQYLVGKKKIDIPINRRKSNGKSIIVKEAKENNLKNVDVEFPLGTFTCITGVSGSGKSTLINEILYKGLNKKLNNSKEHPGLHKEILGIENIDKIINIDQSPIGRTPRSNPATYTGVFDGIREVFSNTTESKMRGYKPGRFSFNVKGGRCEACKGDGIIKIEMQFLSDVYVPCEICKGKRYNRETLEVKYKNKNISEILDMTVEESVDFFKNIPKIKNKLQTLMDVGLGYVRLGQPSTQLSGGEAQRIKLASELSKRSTGKTLYILDEPTTGLHIDDVNRLISIIQRLVDGGNTAIIIEHNLDVIKSADYIIDLGPEGGAKGGEVIGIGTPEEISVNIDSYTGHYLKKML